MKSIHQIRNEVWQNLEHKRANKNIPHNMRDLYDEILVVEMLVDSSQIYLDQRLGALDNSITSLEAKLGNLQIATTAEFKEVEADEATEQAQLATEQTELQTIESNTTPTPVAATVVIAGWGSTPTSYPIEKEIHMSDVSFADNSTGDTGALALTDADGATVTPATPPTWSASDNGALITLDVAADGLSATAVPVEPVTETLPATSDITITVTNADGTTFTLSSVVTVTASDATAGSVSWTPIVPAPPAASPTLDPANSQPLYSLVAGGSVEDTYTEVTDVTDSSGNPLYTFNSDVANGPATGGDANYVVYTGTTEPVASPGATPSA